MRKHYGSKLDSFADQLDHWFGVEKITLAQAVERLRELGCTVSVSAVSCWREARQRRQMQERLLGEITSGAPVPGGRATIGQNRPAAAGDAQKTRRKILISRYFT